MTREEAIEQLWNIGLNNYRSAEKDKEALDMGIEALKNDFTADDAKVLFNRCIALTRGLLCMRCGLREKCEKYRGIMKE